MHFFCAFSLNFIELYFTQKKFCSVPTYQIIFSMPAEVKLLSAQGTENQGEEEVVVCVPGITLPPDSLC